MRINSKNLYSSKSGIVFELLHNAKHGQDCSYEMVVYRNVQDTRDTKAGQIWVMDKSVFNRTMTKL